MFIIMDETNTARCTFNNPFTGCSKTVLTGEDARSIYVARLQFAYSQGIHHSQVEASILYPTKRIAA